MGSVIQRFSYIRIGISLLVLVGGLFPTLQLLVAVFGRTPPFPTAVLGLLILLVAGLFLMFLGHMLAVIGLRLFIGQKQYREFVDNLAADWSKSFWGRQELRIYRLLY